MSFCTRPDMPRPFKQRRAHRWWATLALACLLVTLIPRIASAQIGVPPTPAPTTKTAAGASTEVADTDASLKAHLADTEAGLAAIEKEQLPPGISEEERKQRRATLGELAMHYRIRVNRLQDFAELETSPTLIKDQSGIPTLEEAPSYSFLAVDQLRELGQSLVQALAALAATATTLNREYENESDNLAKLNALARQAAERLEASPSAETAPALRWRRDLAQLQARAKGLLVSGIDLERKITATREAIDRGRLEQVRATIARTKGKIHFSNEDLGGAKAALEAERAGITAELQGLTQLNEAAATNLREAENSLAEGAKTGAPPENTLDLQRALELRHAEKDANSQRARLLLLRLQGINREEGIWEQRWSLSRSADAATLAKATAEIQRTREDLGLLASFVDQRFAQYRDLLVEREGLARQGQIDKDVQHHTELAGIYRQRLAAFTDLQQRLATLGRLLDRWSEDVETASSLHPVTSRLQTGLIALWEGAQALWDFEVFTVEDRIEVDGRIITGNRGVTVGKFVSALLILALGYWLSRWLSRRVERWAVTRGGMDAAHAKIARRWVDSMGLVILAIIALIWVKIPLTAFAFLGGAVAIGLGFGMQTLLKNLISGLMILIERPFHLGDLVEVGNIRGRVSDIGVRSSVVRDPHGIETLIPNSSFLEQNVTNWTYTHKRVRFSVQVGVAYGSELRKVRDVLEGVAQRHGLVLREPPPFVLLDDFGPDALLVSLNFWLELRQEVDRFLVQSDLRFMIAEALPDAGILIAYPQRDLHIDTSRPLEIQLMRSVG